MESSARVLIVANQTAATPTLIEAVRRRAASGPSTFMLLVPQASHGLGKLVSADATASDTDESETVLGWALPLLEDAAGGKVDGMIGDLATGGPTARALVGPSSGWRGRNPYS